MNEFSNTPLECCAIGDFRVLRELARGVDDVVYEGCLASLADSVAIKVHRFVSGDVAENNSLNLARWQFRVRSAMRLHHTHIVPIQGVGALENMAYYVMPMITGRNLRTLLNKPPATDAAASSVTGDPAEATEEAWMALARWGIQASEALAYAHNAGVIHGRLTPSKIIIDDSGKLWIGGFAESAAESNVDISDSPRRNPNTAGDVYALGTILHELANSTAILSRLGITSSEIPKDLDVIIRRAIHDNPRERYSAEALVADLRRYLNHEPLTIGSETLVHEFSRWYRKNTVAARLVLSTVAMLLIALWIVGWRWQLAERQKLELLTSRNEAIALRESAMLAKEAKDEALQAALARLTEPSSVEVPVKHLIPAQPAADRTASIEKLGSPDESATARGQAGS